MADWVQFTCFLHVDLTAGKYLNVWDTGLLPPWRVAVGNIHIYFNRYIHPNYKSNLFFLLTSCSVKPFG